MQKSPIVASGLLNQAYARLDGSLLQSCTLNTVSGKTQVTLNWSYSNGVNTSPIPAAFGTIDVYINGQFIPRQNSAGTLLTSGAFYKEISSTVIELDTNYSATPYAIQIIQRQPIGNFTSSTGSSSSAVGSGLKNYLTTYKNNPGNGNFETGDTSGWSKFNTTLTGVIPTGSISTGAGTIDTFLATTTTPLAATYSLLVSASSSLTVGQGFISDAFTIDAEDQAKVLTFSFAYQAVSGTMNFSGTSSNTWAVYIYDATVGTWIQPAGVYNLVQSSGAGLATGTFQTTSTSTSYRIAVVCINTASGISVKFDSFFVGPQISVNAPAVGDLVSYTPTFSVSFGGPSPINARYRRVGDSLEVIANFTPGTTTAAIASMSLPSGLSIDTAKMSGASTNCYIGYGAVASASNPSSKDVVVITAPATSTTNVYFSINDYTAANSPLTPQNASAVFYTGLNSSIQFRVPIVGWSSNTVASADTDTRVVAAAATGNANLGITANAVIPFTTVLFDTHGITTIASGRFTIPVSGYYTVSLNAYARTTGTGGTFTLWKTGSSNTGILTLGVAASYFSGSSTFYFNAGDYFDIRSDTNLTLLAGFQVSMQRISGPAVVQASETVACRYSNISGTLTTSTDSLVTFTTKDFDTHNAYASGLFTVPVSGIYQVNAQIVSTSATASRTNAVSIFKGASIVYYKYYGLNTTAGGTNLDNAISGLVKCVAGDTISVKVWDNGTSPTVFADNTRNNLSIVRVGN